MATAQETASRIATLSRASVAKTTAEGRLDSQLLRVQRLRVRLAAAEVVLDAAYDELDRATKAFSAALVQDARATGHLTTDLFNTEEESGLVIG